MNRAPHTTSVAANHKAVLSVRIHVKDQTIPIRACAEHGLVISHALPTQALPGITKVNMINNPDELIEALDELIEQIDRYHEAIRVLIEELKQDD
jgi:hypothetical protein